MAFADKDYLEILFDGNLFCVTCILLNFKF